MTDVNRRMNVISSVITAEMSHFKEERDTLMKQALKSNLVEFLAKKPSTNYCSMTWCIIVMKGPNF